MTNTDRKSVEARLAWQMRRGMWEIDLFFEPFIQKLDTLSNEECDVLADMLEASDPEIYLWLMQYESPPEKWQSIIDKIIAVKRDSGA